MSYYDIRSRGNHAMIETKDPRLAVAVALGYANDKPLTPDEQRAIRRGLFANPPHVPRKEYAQKHTIASMANEGRGVKVTTHGSFIRVSISENAAMSWAAGWPGARADIGELADRDIFPITLDYAKNGDLMDIETYSGDGMEDSAWFTALAEEAGEYATGEARGFRVAKTTRSNPPKRLSRFVMAYIECGLTLDEKEYGANWSIADVSSADLRQIEAECAAFEEIASHLLDGHDDEQVAYDFWLTRNGHGAGFWDGDYGMEGDELTKLAKQFSPCAFTADDDGMPSYFTEEER